MARVELDRVDAQVQGIRPRFVIPFASFVRFGHEENAYLNDYPNTIHTAEEAIRTRTPAMPIQRGDCISLAELCRLGTKFVRTLRELNHTLYMWRRLRPAYIWVSDHQQALQLSIQRGVRVVSRSRDDCDVALASDALAYVFRFLWGGETLYVNARYQVPARGGHRRFEAFTELASINNRGGRHPTLWGAVKHKVTTRILPGYKWWTSRASSASSRGKAGVAGRA